MKKRRLAFALLFALLALVAATLVVLRTRWAGDRICAIAAARVEGATGLAVSVEACRIDPIRLELAVDRLALGPPGAPVFTADAASARLAPVQGLGRRLELAELALRRPRLALALPSLPQGGACPPPWVDGVAVGRLAVADGAVDLALPGGVKVRATGLGVDGRAAEGIGWRLGRAPRRLRLAVGAAEVEVERSGQRWRVAQPAVEGAVALDLSGLVLARAEASAGGARFGLRGTVADLCAPSLDLVATADGTLEGLVGLLGVSAAPWQGHVVVETSVKGRPAAPQVGGTVRFDHLRAGPVAPGAGQGRFRWLGDRIAVDELVVPFSGGAVKASGDVKLARGAPLDLAVKLEGVELAELLERVAVPGAWVTVRLDGAGHLAGPVAMPTALVGHVDAQVRGFRSLTGSWRAAHPGDFTFLQFERGRVRAPFRIDQHGIFFDQARLEVGAGHADVDAAVHFDQARGFEVRAVGDVDLGALGHVAGLPWSGRAQVTARIGAAPYGNPRAEAQVRAEQLHFLKVDLGSATADVAYGPDYALRFTNVDGQRGQSRYRGWATVDLGRKPTWVTASRFTGSGRLRDFFDAVLDWLPKTRVLRDVMDGQVAEVTATASGPAAALDADFTGRLGPGELLGRRYDGGRLSGRIAGASEARFDRLELQYGPGTATATGRWGMALPFPWSLDVALAGVPVAALGLPGGGWGGSVSGQATLAGSWEQPDVHFALNGDAVALRGAPLGTVQLGGTVVGRRVLVTGGADGVRFSGEARLEGRIPWKATAALELLDAARLWPGGPPAGLKAAVEGEVTAEGEAADLRAARGQVRLDRLQASYADLKLEAAEPIRLRFDRGALEVERFAVRGADTELALTGAVGAGGELDLLAEGSVDLRLLGGVLPALRRPHGRLAVEAHVGGTTDEPVLLGDGRLEEAGFQLRGATAAFEGLRGDLAFSQNKVLFDALTAQVNGGLVGLSGEVELERLVPARLKVEAQLDEVPVAVPPTLPAVLSGRLEAAGTPDETLVTGRLHVVRARYTQDVGLEKGVLDPRRRRAAARAYDKAGEWLRFDLQLVVDGDARVDNDLVRGGMKGELTLTGSLAAPGLVGTLAMTDGSRAVFRGNEFALSHAIVDFTDRHKVEMALDVHGESRVSDYQVFMHLFGSMADPQVTLTSAPPLSQPDIITLLSMGFTRRDAPLGAGTQGLATAAAAQALFSASGLDEQVRRFLPSGGPLRDMSVRITSVYSEQTGLVEPRAEFESWVVKDRLRLRYQAPLSGARGQRAQAELRLGDHTALQYQWDTDNREAVVGDHGLDLKLRWEWTE
ncbi:MAG TPA: translocation/assembly module TamB [Anaeromyxobacteraceae bacterium]|nr:translocation/assembly module TamB [Anaeromyxobacteraceae bacterium]